MHLLGIEDLAALKSEIFEQATGPPESNQNRVCHFGLPYPVSVLQALKKQLRSGPFHLGMELPAVQRIETRKAKLAVQAQGPDGSSQIRQGLANS